MVPFGVLLVVFFISMVLTKITSGTFEPALSGNIAMSVMLVVTSLAHFRFTSGMERMLPPFLPFKNLWVILTGFAEIAAAICLLIPSLRVATGWFLIVFFLLLLPANIYAAVNRVNYQQPELSGPGLRYLWFRIPLQLFFIAWIYFFTIRNWPA